MSWVFGEEEFALLVKEQNYYLMEFHKDTPVRLFDHFIDYNKAWPLYEPFYPNGYDPIEFEQKIHQIDQVINHGPKYKFAYALRDNGVFMVNEFRRMCYLIRDVYRRGTFHYPCTMWTDGCPYVMAHPGNHLLFTQMMLNRPIRALFTIHKRDTEKFFTEKSFAMILKKILTLHDLQKVIGRPYSAWLQEGFIFNPAVVVKDDDPKWQQLDRSGFLRWPGLHGVQEWAETQWWYDWFPKVCEGEVPISQHIEVRKGFASKEEMFGHLLGFLLNSDDIPVDDNFAVRNYVGKAKSSFDAILVDESHIQDEIRYFGNRWTNNELRELRSHTLSSH